MEDCKRDHTACYIIVHSVYNNNNNNNNSCTWKFTKVLKLCFLFFRIPHTYFSCFVPNRPVNWFPTYRKGSGNTYTVNIVRIELTVCLRENWSIVWPWVCSDLPYEVHAYQNLGNRPHLMILLLAAQQQLQTSAKNIMNFHQLLELKC